VRWPGAGAGRHVGSSIAIRLSTLWIKEHHGFAIALVEVVESLLSSLSSSVRNMNGRCPPHRL
jgi:hypothetical protein